jgi:hypothetical protein
MGVASVGKPEASFKTLKTKPATIERRRYECQGRDFRSGCCRRSDRRGRHRNLGRHAMGLLRHLPGTDPPNISAGARLVICDNQTNGPAGRSLVLVGGILAAARFLGRHRKAPTQARILAACQRLGTTQIYPESEMQAVVISAPAVSNRRAHFSTSHRCHRSAMSLP